MTFSLRRAVKGADYRGRNSLVNTYLQICLSFLQKAAFANMKPVISPTRSDYFYRGLKHFFVGAVFSGNGTEAK